MFRWIFENPFFQHGFGTDVAIPHEIRFTTLVVSCESHGAVHQVVVAARRNAFTMCL